MVSLRQARISVRAAAIHIEIAPLTCVHGPEVFLGWAVIIKAIFCYHFLSLELLHLITD